MKNLSVIGTKLNLEALKSERGRTRHDALGEHDQTPFQPIRVLHFINSLAVGGTEIALANFVERTQIPFRHTVCCLREIGSVADRFASLAVPVHSLGKRKGGDWTVTWRIARLCRAARPHVAHTRDWGAIEGVIGARLAGVPVVIHSEHGFDSSSIKGDRHRRQLARRGLAPFIDRIVTVSAHLEQRVLDAGVRADKITVVRNGVDATKFMPVLDRERLRRARGYNQGELLIGVVGRLNAIKGHSGLLEAFRHVSTRHRGARLIILGDGPERGALERQALHRELIDKVHFIGYRDDVPDWLRIMDLFVLPSLMEGTSNALLEAMAASLPVVATQVGGNPEVVVDGVTGRLVPVQDAPALAAAMEFYGLNEEARRQHGAAGRHRVVQRYSMDDMVTGYTAVYRDTLAWKCQR